MAEMQHGAQLLLFGLGKGIAFCTSHRSQFCCLLLRAIPYYLLRLRLPTLRTRTRTHAPLSQAPS
jgi:hypothetical protein